ncbi:hypothetical protein GQ54DRAFT_302794 [Martensiomyces pterosporus]|nr:hypothetical protein GQ54DRAFT_302794 [Martensiomyces pterosporus]
MLGSRHQAVVKEIDTARCVGRWHAIGELAERYAKHGPPGQVYSSIITNEARLEEQLQVVTWDPKEHWKNEGEHVESQGAKQIRVAYPMNMSNIASLSAIEKDAVNVGKKTMTKEEEYQHKVVLAKIYFYRGKFDECREVLSALSVDIEGDSLSPAYSKQLYITQMVLRASFLGAAVTSALGITSEMHGDLMEAQSTYDKALSVFKSNLSPQAVIVVPRGSSPSSVEELVNWPEEALYRRALVTLSLGDKIGGLRELSDYIRQMDSVSPSTFRVARRVRANRLFMQVLREDIKAIPPEQLTPELRNEIIDCHRHQMALLQLAYNFPRANEINVEVLNEVDSTVADWNLVRAYSRSDSLRLLELLYQAVHLTYNSPRVMRHLVHALLRFGDYHEAGLAFGTYTMLVERQLEAVRKAINAALSDGVDAGSVFDENTESIQDILETVIVGARLSLVHLSDAHECLSLVHFAHELIDDVEAKDPHNTIVPPVPQQTKSQLLLWKGAAHGRLSQMSREPDNRIHHHTAALQLLQQAADQSPRSYEVHFQLALEQALGARDILAATSSAKHAVALDSKRLEAWHLLVLLSTSRKDYVTAQRVCEVALKQSEWWSVYRDIQQGALAASNIEQGPNHLGLVSAAATNGTKTSPSSSSRTSSSQVSARFGSIESGVTFFDLAITQVLIEAQIKGLAASLKAQPHLFALYGCIYGPVVASSDGLDDASAAFEASSLSGTAGSPNSAHRLNGSLQSGKEKPPSQTSGKRSIAKSLVRSVFSMHARQRSLNLALDDVEAGPIAVPKSTGAHSALRKEQSLSQLRQLSQDSQRPPIAALTSAEAALQATAHTRSLEAAPAQEQKPEEAKALEQAASPELAPSGPQQQTQPKRQRSMPHLRQSSRDSSLFSPDVPTEAYFDSQGPAKGRAGSMGLSPAGAGRSTTVAGVHSRSGVYYTPVPTRVGHQRALASRALCSLWLNSAAAFVRLQRPDEAANAINEAISAWPESPDALTLRGQLELAQKQHFPALDEFHAAVSLESSNIRATVGLAQVEYLLGRRDVALGLLKNITRAHGWSDPEAWYWLGRLEREAALEQVETAGTDAGDQEARDKLAEMPMMKRALGYISYALDLETSQPIRPFSVLRP